MEGQYTRAREIHSFCNFGSGESTIHDIGVVKLASAQDTSDSFNDVLLFWNRAIILTDGQIQEIAIKYSH